MMYSIMELKHGGYQVACRIQDGTERWETETKEKAVQDLIGAAKILNGTTITEGDIHFEQEYLCLHASNTPLEKVMQAVDTEYRRAVGLHGAFSSSHEGYAIIKEEVDELWDGVKQNDSDARLKEEAIQIAAMAIRFCVDICSKGA